MSGILEAARFLLMLVGAIFLGACVGMEVEKLGLPGPIAWRLCMSVAMLVLIWVAK